MTAIRDGALAVGFVFEFLRIRLSYPFCGAVSESHSGKICSWRSLGILGQSLTDIAAAASSDTSPQARARRRGEVAFYFFLRRGSSVAMQQAARSTADRRDTTFRSLRLREGTHLQLRVGNPVLYSRTRRIGNSLPLRGASRQLTIKYDQGTQHRSHAASGEFNSKKHCERQGGIIKYQPTSASAAAWRGFITVYRGRFRCRGWSLRSRWRTARVCESLAPRFRRLRSNRTGRKLRLRCRTSGRRARLNLQVIL